MPHQCTNCGRTFADGSKEMLSGCPDCGGNKFQFRPAGATEGTPSTASDTAQSPSDSSPDSSRTPAPDTSASTPSTEPEDEVAPDTQPEVESGADTSSWPDSATEADLDDTADSDEPAEKSGFTDAAARAGAAVRDRLSRNDDTVGRDEGDPSDEISTEDSAQATARSDVVSREELSVAAQNVDTEDDDQDVDTREDSQDVDAQDVDPDVDTSQTPGPETTAPDDANVVEPPSSDDQPDLDQLRQELNDQFESIKIVSPGQYELNLMELYDRDEYIISLQEDGRYVIEVPDRWREDE